MVCEDSLARGAIGDRIKWLRGMTANFHATRTQRHAGHREARNAARPLGKDALHVGNRHMAPEDHPIDEGGMAGRQASRNALCTLERSALAVVDDDNATYKLLANLVSPLLKATAARVTAYGDILGGHGNRGGAKGEQSVKCEAVLIGSYSCSCPPCTRSIGRMLMSRPPKHHSGSWKQ